MADLSKLNSVDSVKFVNSVNCVEIPFWFGVLKKRALELSKQLSEPSFKYGLSLVLDKQDFSFSSIASFYSSIVGVNCADSRVVVRSLSVDDEFLSKFIFDRVSSDKILALNLAFSDSIVVEVPANISSDFSIKIHENSIISSAIPSAIPPAVSFIIVRVGAGSSCNIFEDFSSSAVVHSFRVILVLDDGSKVSYVSLQNSSLSSRIFVDRSAFVGRNSHVVWDDCVLGGSFVVSSIRSKLLGDGAVVSLNSSFLSFGNQQFSLRVEAVHDAPCTKSDLFVRGALTDSSKAVILGSLSIGNRAPKSLAYQKSDALLLSSQAEADAVPELAIDNNDVRCTHGASVGKVDFEKLFYLLSRGISESDARRLLVEGFFSQFISKVNNFNNNNTPNNTNNINNTGSNISNANTTNNTSNTPSNKIINAIRSAIAERI